MDACGGVFSGCFHPFLGAVETPSLPLSPRVKRNAPVIILLVHLPGASGGRIEPPRRGGKQKRRIRVAQGRTGGKRMGVNDSEVSEKDVGTWSGGRMVHFSRCDARCTRICDLAENRRVP